MSGSRRISELVTASAPLLGDELMVLVQAGETKQAEVSLLRVLAPVIAVNGKVGSVLLNASDIPGLEQIVIDGGVSARIQSVAETQAARDFNLACSDEITAITSGQAIEFSFPRPMTISNIVFECNVAPTSVTCELEIRVSASTLHSGYVNIDPGQRTSRTAVVTTSVIRPNIAAWERGVVSVASTDATFAGLKLYILGTAPT